ncbi:hypothetical protein [Plastoroseomonas arctica]|uniref:Uncharacterized protein n=1 Tax=Plastoroseomonas arctica TaxID=1509237 RepID=A0AAF1K3W3_9PROT|nr:hypothetical protein [Plastoroseomonas arctica]MBR0655776.1 hypothetical protein [Plastoroseomonas arctica]
MIISYSFNHRAGTVQLRRRDNGTWLIVFQGEYRAHWPTPDAAVRCIRSGQTGLKSWDERADKQDVPDSLVDWYPVHARR